MKKGNVMRVLFILPNYPINIRNYIILPSLEIATMASVLEKNGHTVYLVDMKIENLDVTDLKNRLQDVEYDLVCVESIVQDHCEAIKVINEVKRINCNAIIVLRGEICSFLPYECMEHIPNIDYVMRFENEKTIIELINCLNGKIDIEKVHNIAYRDDKDNIIVNTLEKPIENLDDLPMPKRQLYDLPQYFKRSKETIVRSSRGCPGKCKFCNKTQLAPFRTFSINRFCDEIEELISYGFSQFFFSDDTFAYSNERLDEFYYEVKKRNLNIRFTSNLRIIDINEEKIKKMKEVGAYRVFVGIETINAVSSKNINKNITSEYIIDKINILKKYNMEYHASFIVGSPDDTIDDLKETSKFIQIIEPTLVSFNQLKPMPGTDIYNFPEKYGVAMKDRFWFEKDDWSRRCICSTKHLTAENIDEWKYKLIQSFIQNEAIQ